MMKTKASPFPTLIKFTKGENERKMKLFPEKKVGPTFFFTT